MLFRLVINERTNQRCADRRASLPEYIIISNTIYSDRAYGLILLPMVLSYGQSVSVFFIYKAGSIPGEVNPVYYSYGFGRLIYPHSLTIHIIQISAFGIGKDE